MSIYLGEFNTPISDAQAQVLCGRDVVVLNPLQPGIKQVLEDSSRRGDLPRSIIGRIDLASVLKLSNGSDKSKDHVVSCLDRTMSMVISAFQGAEGQNNGFDGVLLAGWELFHIPVFHELCNVIFSIGLEVYVETSAPNFLADSTALACSSIAGLFIRNGLVLPDGARRDCFDMEPLRPTVKAFVSQSCVRNFRVFLWETLDDGAVPSNAVLKRTFAWCNFYSVVSWIGPLKALGDATVDVVGVEPLSAFAWLKEKKVMELHDLWKSNQAVSGTRAARYILRLI